MDINSIVLCISNSGIIWHVPMKQIKTKQIVNKSFKNTSALITEIMYLLEDGKPKYILNIYYNRVTFDLNGKAYFDINQDNNQNFFEYLSHDKVSNNNQILPEPVLPNDREVFMIKTYLNSRYPSLLDNTPYAVEQSINEKKEMYNEHVKILKEINNQSTS